MKSYTKTMNKENEKPPDPKGLNFSAPWITVGGETPAGKPMEGEKSKADHGEKEARNGSEDEPEEVMMEEDVENNGEEGNLGRDFAVKLEFKLPKEARSFNCAALHRKWFELVKRIDNEAKLITVNNTAISSVRQFPKDQTGYNKAFPQRVTKQPGQAKVAEVVFEMRTDKKFQELKTNNLEMMGFLKEHRIYFKRNVSNQTRRDSIGFLTHVHPRYTWREELQETIIETLKEEMKEEEIEKFENAGENGQGYYLTLSFRKQYINVEKNLIHTEALEVQTAPELKEIIARALMRASKNKEIPGNYIPYAVVKNTGKEEFAKILKRQNGYLQAINTSAIQGMTKAMLEKELTYNEDGVVKRATVKEIFTMHPSIESIERTAQSGEMGKYVLVYKKEREAAVNEFIDHTCEFVNNSEIPEEIKHQTYPKIRRTSNSKWASQVQEYTREIIQIDEEGVMPNKPPNYWNQRKVTLDNNPEEFPELPKRNKEKRARIEESKNQTRVFDKNKTTIVEDSFDKKIEEIEKKIRSQIEERMQAMEKKCQELEENLHKVFNMVNTVSEQIASSQKTQEKQIEMIMNQFMLMREEMVKIMDTKLTEEGNKKRAVAGKKNISNMST